MPQLIIATVGTSLSVEERDKLRRSIIEQMDGCDVRVVLVPPGVCIQHLPQLPFLALTPPTTQQSSWTVDGEPLSAEQIDKIQREERKALHEYMEQHPTGARTVQHVDTGDQDEEPAGLPPHVWLYRNMLTPLQALAPLGKDDTNGQFAVAIDQLTEAQRRVPHIALQLDEQNNDL